MVQRAKPGCDFGCVLGGWILLFQLLLVCHLTAPQVEVGHSGDELMGCRPTARQMSCYVTRRSAAAIYIPAPAVSEAMIQIGSEMMVVETRFASEKPPH